MWSKHEHRNVSCKEPKLIENILNWKKHRTLVSNSYYSGINGIILACILTAWPLIFKKSSHAMLLYFLFTISSFMIKYVTSNLANQHRMSPLMKKGKIYIFSTAYAKFRNCNKLLIPNISTNNNPKKKQ